MSPPVLKHGEGSAHAVGPSLHVLHLGAADLHSDLFLLEPMGLLQGHFWLVDLTGNPPKTSTNEKNMVKPKWGGAVPGSAKLAWQT